MLYNRIALSQSKICQLTSIINVFILWQMNEADRKLFSVAEAAAELGVTRARVNQLIDSGVLTAQKVGRSYVIGVEDLEKARQRNRNPGRQSTKKFSA